MKWIWQNRLKLPLIEPLATKVECSGKKVSDQQLRSYIMDMMREFASNESSKQVTGSLIIGRQPNPVRMNDFGETLDEHATTGEIKDDVDNAVYILNENVQVII